MDDRLQKAVWQTFPTYQLLQILAALEDARAKGTTKMLIGGTGIGKTYAIEKFKQKYPLNTYVITVSDVYKLEDIIEELCELMLLDVKGMGGVKVQMYRKKIQIEKIVDCLKEINKAGGKPVLIFDEGENMNLSVLKAIKGLYDRLKDNCAIVLIGTGRLVDRMLNLTGKGNRETLPELYSRFKAGYRQIPPVTPDQFAPFLEKYVEDKALRRLICKTLESYRDLNTFLEPVIREAEQRKEPLTEKLYKLYHEINY